MNVIPFLLQIAALVFLAFAAGNFFPTSRVSWGWLGMFLWLLSLMVTDIRLHPI